MLKNGRRIAAGALALAAGCASVPDAPRHPASLEVGRFSAAAPGDALPPGWRALTLSRFKKPTEYDLVERDGRRVIRAQARASASGLVHDLRLEPREYPFLHWRWMVPQLIATADNTTRHAEDSPVRVMVSFDGPRDELPLEERVFFEQVRLLTGREPPYATLMYIWENRAPRESVLANLHTSRIRMIVVESGAEKVGTWREVVRNVRDDYRRAFGAEPGPITAVAIMTDTDNTGESVHAYYGDIQFAPSAPPRTLLTAD